MERVRIVPPMNGGLLGAGTRVLTPEGAEIPSIAAIDLRIRPDDFITATLELLPDLDPILAAPLLGPDTLRRSAEAQGFVLVPKDAPDLHDIALPVEPPSRRSLWLWGLGIVLGFAALYSVLSLAGTALAVLTLGEIVTTLLGG